MAEYRRGNFDFVIDSNFTPFTLQEMLVPFSAYKDVYEQTEAAYEDLAQKSDVFKSLSKDLPEGSLASKIYKGYADELHARAAQLATEGLSMGNRRALANLKRRYQGEIGRLVSAKEAMDKYKELRLARNMQDSSMLYATEDNALNIDSFLDGKTPNLYGISGNELYARGAQAAKSYSSRIFKEGDAKDIIDGYYKEWVEENGMSPESIDAFYQDMSKVPELQRLAEGILKEKGVYKNLRGDAFESAKQSVINGIVDGAIYTRKVTPVRNPGKMDAYQRAEIGLKQQQLNLERQKMAADNAYRKAVLSAREQKNKDKSKGSGKGKLPTDGRITYTTYKGGQEGAQVDKIPSGAKKVYFEPTRDGVRAYMYKSDGTKFSLGRIDSRGKFEFKDNVYPDGRKDSFRKDSFKDAFDAKWNPEYDYYTVKNILRDARDVMANEGTESYRNYTYYLLPKGKSSGDYDAGFFKEPLHRSEKTIYDYDTLDDLVNLSVSGEDAEELFNLIAE